MATSTLDLDNIPEPDRQLGKGHGNKSLGPSDTSDSGSDMQGGLQAIDEPEFALGLDRGTNEDSDTHNIEASDENDDSTGTGEDSTVGREGDVELNADIETDRIDHFDSEKNTGLGASPNDRQSSRSSRQPDTPRRPQR